MSYTTKNEMMKKLNTWVKWHVSSTIGYVREQQENSKTNEYRNTPEVLQAEWMVTRIRKQLLNYNPKGRRRVGRPKSDQL